MFSSMPMLRFEPSDDASARERRALQLDLETAIEKDELFLVYQPFLDLRESRITGFEALLRWRHPVRGCFRRLNSLRLQRSRG